MAKYYKIQEDYFNYNEIKEFDLENETDRGLDEHMCSDGMQHRWLLLPCWNDGVKEGGKQYLICLKCNETNHL